MAMTRAEMRREADTSGGDLRRVARSGSSRECEVTDPAIVETEMDLLLVDVDRGALEEGLTSLARFSLSYEGLKGVPGACLSLVLLALSLFFTARLATWSGRRSSDAGRQEN
jgi:hypothetical protein